MNNSRLKAFTIMEVMISMLIAGLVIGIAYSAYAIIYKSYDNYQQKNDRLAKIILLDRLLKKDFASSDSVYKTSGGFLFIETQHNINYEFDTASIIRISTIQDTFKIKATDLSSFFENYPLQGVSDELEQNRIDELQFHFEQFDEKYDFHYYKTYSAADLIKRNTNAINRY